MNQQRSLPTLAIAFLLPIFLLAITTKNYAQSIVNVNNLTGTAIAAVPICNPAVGDMSAPVSLVYSASGLKVENYDNSFGQGWRLVAGGGIYRDVRGFPDDVQYQSDASYNIIYGWLKSGNAAPQTMQGLTFANNGTLNCSNEISDANTISGNFSYMYDTEPDRFNVNAPGLSCTFIFDGTTNHAIKTIPYRDYRITYTADTYGRVTTFTVTNEAGITYHFDNANFINHSIDIYNPGTTTAINPSTLEAFKRDFMMYRNYGTGYGYPSGYPVRYSDRWMLSKMEDNRGNSIEFTYTNANIVNPAINFRTSTKEMDILVPNGSGGFTKKKLYDIAMGITTPQLQSIFIYSFGAAGGSGQQIISFGWGGDETGTQDKRLMTMELTAEKKTIEMLYTKKFLGSQTTWYAYGRFYLRGLKIHTTCPNVYSEFGFTYYAVDEAANSCYCTPVNNGQTIDTIINAQDYWGYYNGNFLNPNLNPQLYAYPDNYPTIELYKLYQVPGYTAVTLTETANRTVNSHAIDGSLKKITYPTGSTTELEYENNEFLDPDVNGNVPGGGIRIKKITDNDGFNNLTVTNYGYNDPVYTTVTTGRAVSIPRFAMTFQNSTSYGSSSDRLKNSTYKTTYDLNTESEEILYGKVTVTRSGIGKSIYEFNTTGTFGGSAVTDWSQSMNYIARTNLSSPTPCNAVTPNFLLSGKLQYPFVPNPNFDFERGMPLKVSHYNESGGLVASEEYTYDRSHTTPAKVYGIKLDDIGNTMVAYGKYDLNTTVDNFLITKTSKLYNSNTSNPLVDVENYEYTPKSSTLAYRVMKAVRKQNSADPATTVTRLKYSKEYSPAIGNSSDEMNNALYNFNDNTSAFYRNVVIETTQSREQSGQSEKFLGGSFTTYKKVTVGKDIQIEARDHTTMDTYLPYKAYAFANPAGITSFAPTTISSNTFTWDGNAYVNNPVVIEKYNLRGIPEVVSDNSRIPKTVLSSLLANSVKMAEFTNTRTENIGFSNYDYFDDNHNFSQGNNALSAGGRYSTNCLNFQPNTTICRTLTRQTSAKNLIISLWIKDAQTSGTINVCNHKFGGACGTFSCAGSAGTISFTASSEWKYYQAIIPWVSGLTTLSYGLSTTTAIKVDDVMIYPDNASVSSNSYTTGSLGTDMLTAKTGINGIGQTFEYDQAGRPWVTRDQFGNILEEKKYKLVNRHLAQPASIVIGYSNPYTAGVSGNFSAAPPMNWEKGDCSVPVITYVWDFGDGTSTVTTYGNTTDGYTTVSHTYANTGTYQVTVTASLPGMNNVVGTTPPVNGSNPVTVQAAPPPCYPGTPEICASGITQRTSSNVCILSTCNTTPALPCTCNDTYFKLIGITGGTMGSVYSVQWEMGDANGSNWYPEGPVYYNPGPFVLLEHFHPIHTSSYTIRAKVTFCNSFGTTAYSNVILVKNGD